MKWLIGPLRSRFRASTRIATAIVVCLVAIQGFAVLPFLLQPEPQRTLFGLRWLSAATEQAATAAFAVVAERRNEALQGLDASDWLFLSWQAASPSRPDGTQIRPPMADRIEATLRQALDGRVRKLHLSVVSVPPGGRPGSAKERFNTVGLDPGDLQSSMPASPLREGDPEIIVPGLFRIDIQGLDGTWLTVAPRSAGSGPGIWPLIPLVGGTLIVVVLSMFTARRILSPLSQLTQAAERLGIEREPVPISPQGLGEFAAIATAFNEMQSRLKRFVDERTQMLAAMSHDLRTSLTRLKLALEAVGDEEEKRLMTKEIDEMEAMISATLSFASSDAKAEPSRLIDIASLLISVCDDMGDRGSKIAYDGPNHARLSCQPIMMKRALTNVIDNALKYGNEAAVSLAMTPNSAVVRIRDVGPGIPVDLRSEAFAPFRRLENSRNRETGGVGLGLTIARDVMHAHGGTIELANGEPRGLIVTMTLPLQPTPTHA